MAQPRVLENEGEPKTIKFGDLPVVDLPFTRIYEHWWTNQLGPCRDYEMDYIRCQGRVGILRGDTECRKYQQDLQECTVKTKTVSWKC